MSNKVEQINAIRYDVDVYVAIVNLIACVCT